VGGLDEPGPQLLVIDQFEEVFVGGASEVVASRLADLALDVTVDVHVVVVVRADHYPALAATTSVRDLVEDAQVIVGPPTEEELRRIVEVPARRTGCAVEPSLVALIAEDVAGRDAALPLVSAALAQVWDGREGDTLTADRYIELGGLAAAVERMGGRAVERAGGDRGVREVMLRLVDVNEDGQWIRRRVDVADVPSELSTALAALVDARLVQRDDERVDVVHEVVFHAWPLLATWLEEARADLVLDRALRAAARSWEGQGRSDDDVYRGARLAAATDFTARHGDVPSFVQEFVAAGRHIADREHEQVRRQLASEVRARRRLGRALTAAAILLVGALAAGGLAVFSQRRADDERRGAAEAASLAEERQRDAESAQQDAESAQAQATRERDQSRIARLVAESERQLDSHYDVGLLLAAEAYRRTDTPDTRGALLTALTGSMSSEVPALVSDVVSSSVHRTHSQFLGFLAGSAGRSMGLDVSADGSMVASLRYAHDTNCGCALALLFDTISRREIGRFEIPFPVIVGIRVSPDGRMVLAASMSAVYVYDVATGALVQLDVPHAAGVHVVPPFFTADGERFVVGTSDGSLSLWDSASLRQLDVPLPHSPRNLAGVAPDGSLAVGLLEPVVMFWDIDARAELRRLQVDIPSRPDSLAKFVFTSDGSRLAAVEDRGQVVVWDATTGRLRGDPNDRPGAAGDIAFAPGSTTLAIASSTGEVALYDLETEQMIGAPLRAHGSGGSRVAFSADGRYLASMSDDGLIALWGDNTGPGLIAGPVGGQPASQPDYSRDGRLLLLDVGGRPELRNGRAPDNPGLALTPAEFAGRPLLVDELSDDGSTALLISLDPPTTLIAVDTTTGRVRGSIVEADLVDSDGISYPLRSVTSISPDGRSVAVVTQQRVITVWNVETGEQRGRFDAADHAEDAAANAVFPLVSPGHTFSADGRYLYAYSTPSVLRLDSQDLHIVAQATSPIYLWGSVAEVPGTDDVIAAGVAGRIFRWRMTTGELVASGRSGDASLLGNVSVSPDGTVVAAYHQFSAKVALFDAETLRPIGKPIAVSDNLFRPEFTADGRFLAGNGIWEGQATHWTMDPSAWLEAACRAAGRNLTTEEWVEYLGTDEPYRPTCRSWKVPD
jgi:WD40 repeat protein